MAYHVGSSAASCCPLPERYLHVRLLLRVGVLFRGFGELLGDDETCQGKLALLHFRAQQPANNPRTELSTLQQNPENGSCSAGKQAQ